MQRCKRPPAARAPSAAGTPTRARAATTSTAFKRAIPNGGFSTPCDVSYMAQDMSVCVRVCAHVRVRACKSACEHVRICTGHSRHQPICNCAIPTIS